MDCKEIQPVHSEGDQPWVFFGRNDAEAETPVLWLPHAKSWFIGKDSDAGRNWGQEEKGTTEDEMAGWHHWLNGRWVWVSSGSWWWTGRPGMLQFMGSQKVGHNWATELNWTDYFLDSRKYHDDTPLASYIQHIFGELYVQCQYISFLKDSDWCRTGQTGQMNWGDTGLYLIKVLYLNTYLWSF